MTLKFVWEAATGQFSDALNKTERAIADAATGAVRDAADLAKSAARANIAAAGFSRKFQNALQAKTYPSRGSSLKPAALIYSKIPYSEIFEEGAEISGKPFLWIPLSNVPVLAGGRRMTPKQFTEKIGVLYTIRRPGKPPMLGAVVRLSPKAKSVSLRALKRGRNPGGRGSVRIVPMFVGVPMVKIEKKIDVASQVRRAADLLPTLYLKNLKADV